MNKTGKQSIFLLIFLLLTSEISLAQRKPHPEPKDTLHDYCAICTNHEHLIILPPYKKSFKQELPFILISGATFGAGFLVQGLDYASPYSEEEIINNPPKVEDINSFDRGSALNWDPQIGKVSDYVLFSTALLPALFLSEHHTGRDIKTLLVMYAEVFTFNYGATEIAKNLSKRPRPYVYNPEIDIGTRTSSDSRKSFFSGHTSQTAAACFYFAKVIHDYHPDLQKGWRIGLWSFAVVVPALNGTFRVLAGKHFPTDVMTGYVIGAASGLVIPELHRTSNSKAVKEQLKIGLFPTKDGMSLNLVYNF